MQIKSKRYYVSSSDLWAASLLFFVPILPGMQFFISHIMLLFFIVFSSFKVYKKDSVYVYLLISFLILLGVFLSSIFHGIGERFVSDYIKIVLYISGIVIISQAYSATYLSRVFATYIRYFPIIFIVIMFFNMGDDFFSYSGRFYLDVFGSPNAFGIVAGISLIYLIFNQEADSSSLGIINILLIIFYLFILLITVSRGAVLGLLFVLIFTPYKKYLLLFLLFSVIAFLLFVSFIDISTIESPIVNKLNLYEDFVEKGGSYRTLVWYEYISDFMFSPGAWLYGFGPGKVIMTHFGTEAPIYHPHNTYLYALHSFGLFGFFGFLYYLYCLFSRLKVLSYHSVYLYMLLYYLFIFLIDVHLSSSQFIPMHVVVLAMITSASKIKRVNVKYLNNSNIPQIHNNE